VRQIYLTFGLKKIINEQFELEYEVSYQLYTNYIFCKPVGINMAPMRIFAIIYDKSNEVDTLFAKIY
jgi:hypothetical protein